MPVYPVLAVLGGRRRRRARAPRAAHRHLPPAGLLDRDAHRVRVHDPGRRLADEAVGADRHLPRRRHQRAPADLGHPRRGVRLRLRPADPRDPGLGAAGVARRPRDRSPLAWRVRRHGGGELRRPPLGDARARHGLAPQPPRAGRPGRFERNDLFPLCFSVVGVAAVRARPRSARHRTCCSGSASASPPTARSTCSCTRSTSTAACPCPCRPGRYLDWLRDVAPRPPPRRRRALRDAAAGRAPVARRDGGPAALDRARRRRAPGVPAAGCSAGSR